MTLTSKNYLHDATETTQSEVVDGTSSEPLKMLPQKSLKAFLGTAHAALKATPSQRSVPLHFVVGNESAGVYSILSHLASPHPLCYSFMVLVHASYFQCRNIMLCYEALILSSSTNEE